MHKLICSAPTPTQGNLQQLSCTLTNTTEQPLHPAGLFPPKAAEPYCITQEPSSRLAPASLKPAEMEGGTQSWGHLEALAVKSPAATREIGLVNWGDESEVHHCLWPQWYGGWEGRVRPLADGGWLNMLDNQVPDNKAFCVPSFNA